MLNGCLLAAFPDTKYVLQAESVTGEGSLVAELVYDNKNVLEIWDQPSAVLLYAHDKNGRAIRKPYTPEYLAIKLNEVNVYQYKPEEELQRLLRSYPRDWCYVDGTYHYLPAERAYGLLGINHIVVSSTTFNPIRTENLLLLLHLRLIELPKRALRRSNTAITVLKANSGMSLAALADRMGMTDLTPILYWIASGIIFSDLSNCRLSEPESAWVTATPSDLDLAILAKKSFLPVGDYIDNLSTKKLPTLNQALVKWLRLACLGFSVPLPPKTPPLVRKPRTLRRWKKVLRDSGGDPESLNDRTSERGPKPGPSSWRLSKAHESLISRAISKFYNTPEASRPRSPYIQYERMFDSSKSKKLGPKMVDIKTFKERIRYKNAVKLAQARGGKRAAHAAAPPTDPAKRDLRASRAWQRGHIDHYLCDFFVVVIETNHATYRVKPILTLMTDEYSTKVLAMVVNLSAPSRRSLAGVIRDCVRRHGRLPERLVVDNGSEFRSVYFEAFLASQVITKQETPKGAPRFHGSLERMFGIAKEEILALLPGNSTNDSRGRAASPSHRSSKTSKITPYQLYVALDKYFFEHYNVVIRGDRTSSPDVLFDQSVARFRCSGVPVKYDVAFLIRTALPAEAQRYNIDPTRGVRVTGRRYYRHPALAITGERYIFDPMVEPWDDNIAYIPLRGKWLIAYHDSKFESLAADGPLRMTESSRRNDSRAAKKEAKLAADIALARMIFNLRREFQLERTTKSPTKKNSVKKVGRRIKRRKPPVKPLPLTFRRAA